jgi:hypothetical protein
MAEEKVDLISFDKWLEYQSRVIGDHLIPLSEIKKAFLASSEKAKADAVDWMEEQKKSRPVMLDTEYSDHRYWRILLCGNVLDPAKRADTILEAVEKVRHRLSGNPEEPQSKETD